MFAPRITPNMSCHVLSSVKSSYGWPRTGRVVVMVGLCLMIAFCSPLHVHAWTTKSSFSLPPRRCLVKDPGKSRESSQLGPQVPGGAHMASRMNPSEKGTAVTTTRQAFSSSSAAATANSDSENTSKAPSRHWGTRLRHRLRELTGFSLTAFCTTLRGVTGISLTALYVSTWAATGAWMRLTMKVILSIFPDWFRSFLQPFLILYYAPLFILRNVASPTTRGRARATHEHFLAGWRQAVETADRTTSYWPVHVVQEDDPRGGGSHPTLEKDLNEMDWAEAVAASVEVALEEEENEQETTKRSSST